MKRVTNILDGMEKVLEKVENLRVFRVVPKGNTELQDINCVISSLIEEVETVGESIRLDFLKLKQENLDLVIELGELKRSMKPWYIKLWNLL